MKYDLVPCSGVLGEKKEIKKREETTSVRNQKQSPRSTLTFPPPHRNSAQLLVTIGSVSLLLPKTIWTTDAISSRLLGNWTPEMFYPQRHHQCLLLHQVISLASLYRLASQIPLSPVYIQLLCHFFAPLPQFPLTLNPLQ